MRSRSVVALSTAAVLAVGGVAVAGGPQGQGAQKSGLAPVGGLPLPVAVSCSPGSGPGTNGFTVLNSAGRAGAPTLTNGQVSLKGATPDTDYVVHLATGSQCTTTTAPLRTNGQGNGSAHLQKRPGVTGTYYVVVSQGGLPKFASGAVTLR